MAVSPSPLNYYIGRGAIYMKEINAPDDIDLYTHLGNCPRFSVTPHNTVLEKFTVVDGVRVVEGAVVTDRTMDVAISTEEFTAANLIVALGAELYDAPSQTYVVKAGYVTRSVRFYGSNESGPQVQIYLPQVMFVVDSAIQLISEQDAWMALELTGRALYYPGFGYMSIMMM